MKISKYASNVISLCNKCYIFVTNGSFLQQKHISDEKNEFLKTAPDLVLRAINLPLFLRRIPGEG